jgi:hypothetical protein
MLQSTPQEATSRLYFNSTSKDQLEPSKKSRINDPNAMPLSTHLLADAAVAVFVRLAQHALCLCNALVLIASVLQSTGSK